MIKQITAHELNQLLNNADSSPLLLDVREVSEFQHCHIKGSRHIPMGEVSQRYQELNEDDEIVVICHHGMRSQQVAMFLLNQGFGKIHNLQGGIDNWAVEVDTSMARY